MDPTPSASKKKKKRLKKKKRITDGLGTATSKDKATVGVHLPKALPPCRYS